MFKVCVSSNCKQNVPSNARFCPYCGTRLNEASLSIPGEYSPPPISLAQRPNINYGELPQLTSYKNYLVCPDSHHDTFRIYDILSKSIEVGRSDIILGGLNLASTPLFDGLFFNVLCRNRLYRFGVNRSGTILSSNIEFTTVDITEKVDKTILLEDHDKRYLLFIHKPNLYCLDISLFSEAETSIPVTLYPLPNPGHDATWNDLIAIDNARKIFLLSNTGGLYYTNYDNMLGQVRSPWTTVQGTGYHKCSKSFIIRNNLAYLTQQNDNRIHLHLYNLSDNRFSTIELPFPVILNLELPDVVIHSNNRIMIFDPTERNKAIAFDITGNCIEVIFNLTWTTNNYDINLNHWIIDKDNFYTFIGGDKILEINLVEHKLMTPYFMSAAIGVSYNPINQIHLGEGFIALQTLSEILIVRI